MIHWLFQSAAGMPAEAYLLSLLGEEERSALARYTVPKRRGDWLLGRWTAKMLLQAYLCEQGGDVPLDRIVIQADPDGAPFASLVCAEGVRRLDRLPISLSISHSHGHAFCALVEQTAAGEMVGADLEFIEPRDPSFTADFFTPAEQAGVAAAPEYLRATRVTALWSAKEAVLKALRAGLRVDTRQVEIVLPAVLTGEWSSLAVALGTELAERHPGAWSAWVQCRDGFVLTMALRESVEMQQAAGTEEGR